MSQSDGSIEQHSEGRRALQVFAKSVFKELKRNGYDRGEMVAFASELLELVTRDTKAPSADAE
jgi:hypothetical protein